MKSLQLSKPHLLIIIGGPGSGKTTFASKFADTFHSPFINGGDINQTVDQPASALKLVQMILAEMQKTKQTLIYEPISGTRAERSEIARMASKAGYTPLLVWVQADAYTSQSRLTRKSRRNPEPISDEEFERQLKRFTPPSSSEKYVVISGMHTYATQAKVVLKKLSQQVSRPLPSTPTRPEQTGRRTVMVQ